MDFIQIVLDTNILVVALRSKRGASFKLVSLIVRVTSRSIFLYRSFLNTKIYLDLDFGHLRGFSIAQF